MPLGPTNQAKLGSKDELKQLSEKSIHNVRDYDNLLNYFQSVGDQSMHY